jgi:hypothetical protein
VAAWRSRIVEGMSSRWSRVLRGLGAGSSATLVAAASHAMAGDRAPSAVGLTLALFFAGVVSIALAGRRLSAARLAASVAISQLAFHVVFSTLGGAAEVVTTGHHQTVVGGVAIVTHASGGMWIAHGTAAVLTTLLLVFGERAFYGLRDTARMLLGALLTPHTLHVVAIDRAPLPAPVTPIVARVVREFHAARGLRGPPPLPRSA